MKRRGLSWLLALTMMVGLIPITTLAAEETATDHGKYDFASVREVMEVGYGEQTIAQNWENVALDGVEFSEENCGEAVAESTATITAIAPGASDVMKAIFTLAMLGYDPTEIVLEDGAVVNGVAVLNEVLTGATPSYYTAPFFVQILELWGEGLDTATNLTQLKDCLITALATDSTYSWGLDGAAMALMGLAPYYGEDDGVTAAVDGALNRVESTIAASTGLNNSNTNSMVIVAYTMVGKDPSQLVFSDGETSVVDQWMALMVEDGFGFGYTSNETFDLNATKQGMVALKALALFEEEGGAINPFDLTEIGVNVLNLAPITVVVNMSNNGEFVVAMDGTTMVGVEVTLEGTTRASYDIHGVLETVHQLYGHGDGYGATDYGWGLALDALWGDTSGNFGYWLDGDLAWSLEDSVVDGAVIDAFVYGGNYYDGTSESYTRFTTIATSTVGETVTVTLEQAGYDDNWNTVFFPCEGATIYVDGVDAGVVTDENGEATVLFDQVGHHWLTAKKDANGDGITDIVAPYGAVTVVAQVGGNTRFSDVEEDSWYYDAVDYVVSAGLFNGTGEDTFAPYDTMTRAMVWMVLAREAGVDTTTDDIWYQVGQSWAMDCGISDGFDPSGEITREQLVTMIYRYGVLCGMDVSLKEDVDLSHYTDLADVGDYATEAMEWGCGAGIIDGTTSTTLSPCEEATRAQTATILMRYLQL